MAKSNAYISWKNGMHFGATLGFLYAGLECAFNNGVILNGFLNLGALPMLLAIPAAAFVGSVIGSVLFGALFASSNVLAENIPRLSKLLGTPQKAREVDYGHSRHVRLNPDNLTIDFAKEANHKPRNQAHQSFVERLEEEREAYEAQVDAEHEARFFRG